MNKKIVFIVLSFIFMHSLTFAQDFKSITADNSEKAPDFELDDMGGTKHRLSDYHGRVVLINFWAAWCRECVAEIPSLNGLYKKFKDKGVVVLGVTIDRDDEDIRKSLKKVPVAYPVLVDRDSEVFSEKYTLRGLPITVVIDKKGYIADKLIGRSDFGSAAFMKKIDILSKGRSR